MIWNETALSVLKNETNVYFIEADRISFGYSDDEYAEVFYIHNNDELLETAREIVAELNEIYHDLECPDMLPPEYLSLLD